MNAPDVVDAAVEVRGLRKRFGVTVAVDDVSFHVPAGQVTGFVGPNGSGKSTTLRMILGLDRPDAGTALVTGRPYRRLSAPLRTVGALLDASAVHPARRARDHLLWVAQAGGLPTARVDHVLDLVGLADVARRPAGGFSHGMLRRLGVATALLGDPSVLLLDEPANGLDPEDTSWMSGLLRSLAGDGRAVLVSSHLLAELEGTADRVVALARGRLLAQAGVPELCDRASAGRFTVRTARREPAIEELARAGATVAAPGGDRLTVSGMPAQRVRDVLTRADVDFTGPEPHRASLEEAYMALLAGDLEPPPSDPPPDPDPATAEGRW